MSTGFPEISFSSGNNLSEEEGFGGAGGWGGGESLLESHSLSSRGFDETVEVGLMGASSEVLMRFLSGFLVNLVLFEGENLRGF